MLPSTLPAGKVRSAFSVEMIFPTHSKSGCLLSLEFLELKSLGIMKSVYERLYSRSN